MIVNTKERCGSILLHLGHRRGAAARAAGPEANDAKLAVALAEGARGAAAGVAERRDDGLVDDVVLGDQAVTHDHRQEASAAVAVVHENQGQAAEAAVVLVGLLVDGVALAGDLTGHAEEHIEAAGRLAAAVAEAGAPTTLNAGGLEGLAGDLVGDSRRVEHRGGYEQSKCLRRSLATCTANMRLL